MVSNESNNLNPSQQKAFLCIQQNENIFISGIAGSGKTWLLTRLEKLLTGRPVLLTATSGIASIVLGGATVSSMNMLALLGYSQSDESIRANNPKGKFPLDTIIVIDEVGLLSTEQFRQLDVALRAIGRETEFLGGFQVVIGGDFGQMPTIHWGESLEGSMYLEAFKLVELVENIRQKDDPEFFKNLMEIRENGMSDQNLDFIKKHASPEEVPGPIIVATRSLMDRLNNSLERPKRVQEYVCHPKDPERLYESICIWKGLPVMLTKNKLTKDDTEYIYANGDIATVLRHTKQSVLVKVHRTGKVVLIELVKKNFKVLVDSIIFSITDGNITFDQQQKEYFDITYEIDTHDKKVSIFYRDYYSQSSGKGFHSVPLKDGEQAIEFFKEYSYEYLPILPAVYLSIRRVQGVTLTSGGIHESILYPERYTLMDRKSIQYTALSRFEKVGKMSIRYDTDKEPLFSDEKITDTYF